MTWPIGAQTVERVYAALEHEADMDGLVTASSARLGELAGIEAASANLAVHQLAESGRIEVKGRTAGRGPGAGSVLLVQMASSS